MSNSSAVFSDQPEPADHLRMVAHLLRTQHEAVPIAGEIAKHRSCRHFEDRPVRFSSRNIAAIREGMGIGMVPLYAAIDGLRERTLVRVLPAYTLQKMNVYALYPSRRFLDAKTRTWVAAPPVSAVLCPAKR
jgi:DNA-binding transcriptional LysR family regulator